jgi:PKD repeat protein
MRSLHLLGLSAGIALATAACGDDNGGGNGPQNVAPTASFAAPACQQNTPCTFTDASTDSDGSIASRAWTFENGNPPSSNAQNPQVTFTATGAQTVTLTVTDNEGATDDFSLDVNVTGPGGNQPPVADFSVTCISADCNFTNESTDPEGGALTFAWNFGDGNTSPEANPTHTYTVDDLTPFTVTLTVTDNAGGTAVATQQINVAPPATLTCGTEPNCELTLEADARVTVTLVSSDCQLAGNTFKVQITPPGGGTPVEETLFTDGCDQTEVPPGTAFQLQTNAVFAAGTTITAQVISGGVNLELPPAIQVEGVYPTWTLRFDDGAQSEPPEPDFNDLVLTIQALP